MSITAAGRYDKTTIVLHWVTAALVLILWLLGQTADWFPDGPVNTAMWSTHVVFGFSLAAVLLWRMGWRTSGGKGLPPADSGLLNLAAKSTHYGLYVLLATVVTLGIINALLRGYSIYDVFHLPQFGDRAWRRPVNQWHGLAANITLGLAGVHAVAALFHHYVWRDGLLTRMSTPGRISRPAE